jgi:calcium binding protein 39
MKGLFSGKPAKVKPPGELARGLASCLASVKADGTKSEKAVEDASKYLKDMKLTLYGIPGTSQPKEAECEELCHLLLAEDTALLQKLIENLPKLEFEAKKDVSSIYSYLLRRTSANGKFPSVEYTLQHADIIQRLVLGHEIPDIALCCGQIIREAILHEIIAKYILWNEALFYNFFRYVNFANFEVASDSFATFKDLLTKHRVTCAQFVEHNYDKFFKEYNHLIASQNYVTKRESLKLLGELLLDRTNFNIMTRYIAEPENLKLIMLALKDSSKHIQFEAFHVFKVFVANPNKPEPIRQILHMNRDKLVKFLQEFLVEREQEGDEQFVEEKKIVISEVANVKYP